MSESTIEDTPGAAAPPDDDRITLKAVATVLVATASTGAYAFTWNSVTVALPQMQGSFSATTDQMAWVMIAFVLGSSMVTACIGWLSARLGRKQLFLLSVAGYTISLVGCGMATTLWSEVTWRFLQGVMGAPLVPLGQAIAVSAFPKSRHGQATSLWALGFVSANVISPVIGGTLIEEFGWPWVYYATIPLGLAVIAAGWVLVPNTERYPRRMDWIGFTSLIVGVGVLQLMLARGERLDWFASGEIIVEATITVLCLWIFLAHTITGRDTFIDGRLFLNRNFALGQGFIFMIGSVLFLPLLLLPLLLQQIGGYPAMETGLLMLPRGIGSIIGLTLMTQIRDRVDPRPLVLLGILGMAIPAWFMSGWTTEVRPIDVTVTTFIQGVATSFIWAPLNTLVLSRLDPRVQDQGYALYYLNFDLGSSIGTAAVIGLHARMAQVNHAVIGESVNPYNELFRYPEIYTVWDLGSVASLAALQHEIGRQATMIAYNGSFMVVAGVMLSLIPFIILFRHRR